MSWILGFHIACLFIVFGLARWAPEMDDDGRIVGPWQSVNKFASTHRRRFEEARREMSRRRLETMGRRPVLR
ncbi:hypothetical protein AXW83_02705 [Bosea sp. PAMC 26642]|nr:hypothetical protein AXW83_02705 [Bosea sp. PAMC 26642]